MKRNHIHEIHRINYLSSELDSLYHQASLKLGITDSVSIVLYSIYVAGSECLLSDICKNSGISKQTIHSAVRSLEADERLRLTPYTGRLKKVSLTEKGKDYVQQTVAKLYQAEQNAFDSWSEEEVGTYIALMEKYNHCFRQQIEKL